MLFWTFSTFVIVCVYKRLRAWVRVRGCMYVCLCVYLSVCGGDDCGGCAARDDDDDMQ